MMSRPYSIVEGRGGEPLHGFLGKVQNMHSEAIRIVELGRGPQLSTSRVTVQDLVSYFQEGCSYQEIIRWIPTLSTEEIEVVESYYKLHREEFDDKERQIRERSIHNKNPDWVVNLLKEAHKERLAIQEQLRRQSGGVAD